LVLFTDLAEIVDAQDDDINRMVFFSIGADENTQSGLEHVVRAAKFTEQYQHSQRYKTVLFTLLGVIVVFGFSRALMNGGDGTGPVQNHHPFNMDFHEYFSLMTRPN
jgi:t-SNARE complex subunit (syntaxin)